MSPAPSISGFKSLPRFERALRKLEPDVRKQVKETLDKLLSDSDRSGLRVKKLQGSSSIWSVRVDRNYRISFSLNEDIAVLRNVASHDKLYGSP
jgi:mRNA-degrading endonuclease RelE of RelBE toxin-antitoxin system